MKKQEWKIDRGTKSNLISYILDEYDKNYRKTFKKNEFKDKKALKEVILELKEMGYLEEENNKKFAINILGIRYLNNLMFSRTEYVQSMKLSVVSIVLSLMLTILSNTITIYTFDSLGWQIFLTILEIITMSFLFWFIGKVLDM